MRHLIIESTISALTAITAPRFFKSERGYQGVFYCKLYEEFENRGLANEDQIIEMEYQKSSRHRLSQRPDIIFHIPVEHSDGDIVENNFAVWALKARANAAAPSAPSRIGGERNCGTNIFTTPGSKICHVIRMLIYLR